MEFDIVTPTTKSELLKAIKTNKNNFRFGAGYTDLILELKKKNVLNVTVINLAQLNDKKFNSIERNLKFIRIGALVTASSIVNDKFIEKNFPVLQQAANNLASAQIRQVATIGGNICTASPSGDIACALVALKAKCELLSSTGKTRTVSILEFFLGPRKTAMKKDEILSSVLISLNEKNINIHSGFIKVGTRRSMECSVVSLAYHIQSDKKNLITNVGIAIGSVAPTIRFAENACGFLIGKKASSLARGEKEEFAEKVLKYASPISDIRATAWYRKEALFNICKSILEN
ncbi:MAG: hypothetical protein A3F72_03220 [Bacteroidetes bacterium RIFCSPLOWO2_12_FULL_35_15]|nr:MAG: hypothetical protein A3F72_03220 [Bacteroidetes bacterium RIFCSPLOWO2_12_FULL_35_15]